MADAKKHLSIIPTEYDEDGPMPPIQEALLGINRAKEVRAFTASLARSDLHFPRCQALMDWVSVTAMEQHPGLK